MEGTTDEMIVLDEGPFVLDAVTEVTRVVLRTEDGSGVIDASRVVDVDTSAALTVKKQERRLKAQRCTECMKTQQLWNSMDLISRPKVACSTYSRLERNCKTMKTRGTDLNL